MSDTKVEIYTDKQGRKRRRLVPIDTTDRTPRGKSKGQRVQRTRESLPIDPRTRVELDKRRRRNSVKKEPERRGNPAVVETYKDARENAMINRDVPTMKHGGEAVVRGMGCAIKGGKFEGVF